MRRPTILLMLSLALAALAATPSASSAATLETESGPLGEGAPIAGSSESLVFKTGTLSVECVENAISGQLEANGGEPAEIQLAEGSFTGNEGGRCKTSTGGITADVEGVEAEGWQLDLWRQESEEVEGGGIGRIEAEEGSVTLKVDLYLSEAKIATCIYAAGEVGLEYEFGVPLSAPSGLAIAGATFKKETGSSGTCPEAGELSGEFALSSEALPVSLDGEGCQFDPDPLNLKGNAAGVKRNVKIINVGTANAWLEDAWIEEGGKKTQADFKLIAVTAFPDECALPGAKPFQKLLPKGGFCIIGIEFVSGAAGTNAKFVVEVQGFFRNSRCHMPILS
jgi:hypothetical protein